MEETLTVENRVLLDLLAKSLFDAECEFRMEELSLAALWKEAKAQTVIGYAFDALPPEAAALDPQVYQTWQMHSLAAIQKSVSQVRDNAALERLFCEAKLPICTIKGCASSYYYPKRHLRQMGDIDFIVPSEKMEAGKTLLTEAGFICTDEEELHSCHIGFQKGKEIYEMHRGITPFLDDNGYIESYMEDVFQTSVAADFDGVTITIPDRFTHGLIMLLHVQKHMISGGGVGLRHLCDWAVFVNALENEEWKTLFEKPLKELRLWRFASVLSKVSSLYLKMPEKAWFSSEDEDTARRLLDDILCGGNFGYKDVKRYQELAFVSQGNKKESKWKRGFRFYVHKVSAWNPFYQRHKWLLPIGMIVYPFRTAFLLLFRKKKYDLRGNYQSGNARNRLYDELFQ